MEDLTIHRMRSSFLARPVTTAKAEKPPVIEPEPAQPRVETLERQTAGAAPVEERFRQSGLVLQTGESVLAEVSDNLARIEALLREAESGAADGLPAELERLSEEIDRLLGGVSAGGVQLFRTEGGSVLDLPDWLQNSILQGSQDLNAVLASLGLTGEPDAEEILNAVLSHKLGTNTATDYVATLYLGAVIAGGGEIPDNLDKEAVLDGIRQLLELVNSGTSVDEAVRELSGGTFSGLSAFEAQFSSGEVPDLLEFLSGFLLAEETPAIPPLSGLLDGLTGLEGLDGLEMDLWMLLGSMQSIPGGADAAQDNVLPGLVRDNEAAPAADTAPGPEAAAETARPAVPDSVPVTTLRFGGLEVSGRDLSGVRCENGVLTLDGQADVTVRGTQPELTVRMSGSGAVTLEDARVSALLVDTPEGRVFAAGGSVLERIELRNGAVLVLDGSGRVDTGRFQADQTNTVRLNGGTLLVSGGEERITAGIEINGPAIVPAGAVHVTAGGGGAAESFELLWKTLFPGAGRLIAASVDGEPIRLLLADNTAARLWLDRGTDGSHGYPAHQVVLTGRDETGRRRSQSLFLRWDAGLAQYEETPMYPNPFRVSGGAEGEDWTYDPAARILRILTGKAMTVSGGPGVDNRQNPFSGRVVLADGLGAAFLTLDGTDCQVSFGRAFDLGKNNAVTLFLRGENYVQSGVGCAGLSLGDGTTLQVSAAPEADGTLTASGGFGGAGIGRDRSAGAASGCRIAIRSGSVTARAFGAGAGIGAGRDGAVGEISIAGGKVFAFGGRGGGAAIGGAPGGAAGRITIFGGEVTVSAPSVPNAIGAGAGSSCGEVHIGRLARVVYKDGIPETMGAGKSKGIPLNLGAETVMLPRFRLSAEGLRIRDLDVSTPAGLLDAQRNVSEASRRVRRIHMAYNEMFSRLEEHLYSLWNVRSSISAPLRNAGAANALLSDVRQAIVEQPRQAVGSRQESAAEEIFRLLHKT